MGRGRQPSAKGPCEMTVGKRSDEMTFNTKLDSAFQLAEPASYSGTFQLSDPEAGGTLAAGSDGVITWTPGEDLRRRDLCRHGHLRRRNQLANEDPLAYH